MDPEMVSVETLQEHYGTWRWQIERKSSNRLVKLWSEIDTSGLADDTKVRLANVAWALAAFERAYDVLLADIVRLEKRRNVGVPPVMAFLTGPYENSLDYLLGMGLWMDLGDVLVAYRTIVKRLERLGQRPIVRRSATPWSAADIDREVRILQGRWLPDFSPEPLTILADTILHDTWDPTVELTLAFKIYWKGSNPETLDFAEGDLRGAVAKLVDETVEQVRAFISDALARHATRTQTPQS